MTSGNTIYESSLSDDEIPQYVYDYAPLIHLFSGEQFWPCDIADHLLHTVPYLNFTPFESNIRRNLSDLGDLNVYKREVYLTSDDNVEDRPDWLGGHTNIPESPETCSRKNGDNDCEGGRSDAPAVLIVVPKPDGIVDAFWFFFYSYNLGNTVFRVRFGNHVGDWEHTLVRFQHGKPQEIFFSEHSFGEGYSYAAVEKMGDRPVGFSATGTHAMYATAGIHRYVLPLGLLHDQTDRGPLWDPTLNHYSYIYNMSSDTFLSGNKTPDAPTNWLHYQGHWGDKSYPMSDSRQYQVAGQYHYVSGPVGPRQHNLGRKNVCPGNGECRIKHWLATESELKVWPGHTIGDEYGEGSPYSDDGGTELDVSVQ